MRDVKSRNYFEQMKGRGARVIADTDFRGHARRQSKNASSSSTPSAPASGRPSSSSPSPWNGSRPYPSINCSSG